MTWKDIAEACRYMWRPLVFAAIVVGGFVGAMTFISIHWWGW